MENTESRSAELATLKQEELIWHEMTELPEAGRTVLIHVPTDDEPVWFGFWDGRRWHYIEGLPVRTEVRHWCNVPTPPVQDWNPGGSRTRQVEEESLAVPV